jgi:hypothetical protein
MCSKHYDRWRRHGSFEKQRGGKKAQPRKVCAIPGCDKIVHSHGLCANHYRKALRRVRGLKRGGRYVDLTGQWLGPREDLYVDHEEFPDGDQTKSWPGQKTRWLVFHGIERGGCGASGIMTVGAIRQGDCPGHCRQAARFKAQTTRKAEGRTGRLFPLTPEGSKAIGDANTRDRIAGKRGITTLPRTKDGVALKRTNRRGAHTGKGRGRTPIAKKRDLAAARAKAYRDRKRGAEARQYRKTGDFAA